jgi:glucokinase
MTPARGLRLVADIGGTRARFALLGEGASRPALVRVYDVADFPGPYEAIRAYLEAEGDPPVVGGALAVATAVTGDAVRFTNSPWEFSIDALRAALGWGRLEVVNDFTALARSLPLLEATDKRRIGGGVPVAGAPLALLGPGTGLGVSGLVPCARGWVPIAGEGGHAAFSPGTRREAAVLERLWQTWERVSFERLLSGPGLATLHRTLAALDGDDAPALQPEEVTARALAGSDARCREALALFCAILGTAAANLCLTLGARGGVYIGGGIVPALGDWFAASPFRARFEAAGRFGAYLAAVPTWVVLAPDAALRGAALVLTEPDRRA